MDCDRERPTQCCLIVEGFGIRSKVTAEGKRQILSLHIPGDIPDLQSLHLHILDHDFKTLTACKFGFIAHGTLRSVTRTRTLVAEALWRETQTRRGVAGSLKTDLRSSHTAQKRIDDP